MRYAIDIPDFGYWSDPRHVADFARQVEEAGWDGLSVWDHILIWDGNEVADPWILLAAAASATDRITATIAKMWLGDRAKARDQIAELEEAGATWVRESWIPDSGVSWEDWLPEMMAGPPR